MRLVHYRKEETGVFPLDLSEPGWSFLERGRNSLSTVEKLIPRTAAIDRTSGVMLEELVVEEQEEQWSRSHSPICCTCSNGRDLFARDLARPEISLGHSPDEGATFNLADVERCNKSRAEVKTINIEFGRREYNYRHVGLSSCISLAIAMKYRLETLLASQIPTIPHSSHL
ncbi:hypothetical protein RRG08_019015 [Elysia crispata]|uniref:Uncharacterized protein n=1 Tax=Elysia crispata TaxID=231223 RepID=A0AAE1A4X1_9GAST|nr:hypothetical protein RRG08_019015 [Elysia crispata]